MDIPFKITNPEKIEPGESWILTEKELNEIASKNEALLNVRGRVIAKSLQLEDKLDNILSLVFLKGNDKFRNLFKDIILQKEFFTLWNKWQVFRELTKRGAINFEDDEIRKKILTEIKELIEIRNNFAHGEVIFSGTQPQLIYRKSGKEKKDILDKDYFEELNEKFSYSLTVLNELHTFLTQLAE